MTQEMYKRVLPRDLFNEAKLLKCLGRLCLLIEDDMCKLEYDHDDEFAEGFVIGQLQECGGIYPLNLRFYTPAGDEFVCNSPLNSRRAYSLVFTYKGEECYVFDDDNTGTLSPDFRRYEEEQCGSA